VIPSVAGQHFQKEDMLAQRKKKYLARALYYTIHRLSTHTTFYDPAFRSLFNLFHKDASSIVSAA
jgi:hypothetical protein